MEYILRIVVSDNVDLMELGLQEIEEGIHKEDFYWEIIGIEEA